MNHVLFLAWIASLFILACAPIVVVRPGSVSAPTHWRVRTDGSQVVLVGTMTQWQPQPLAPHDGAFEVNLRLPPGRYEYRLEVRDTKGVRPVFPEGAERTDDGFGGENVVLRIP